ncbi:MAG: MBL fold metallo-hydrolase [Candidatus Omnitrophica bacterium]|nr:MBL fold metallo-hydrolase [Candidatus Omnitrophota bacterium]
MLKRAFFFLAAAALLSVWQVGCVDAGPEKGIEWLGHASFRIEKAKKVVYIDPWRLASEPHDADVILITHSHFDHLSVEDVLKVAKPSTVLVGPPDCIQDLAESIATVRRVKPGESLELDGVTVEVVPAYNTNKMHHPKSKNWAGYVVEMGKERVYHAGDTDVIPEMRELENIDVALLPVSGTYCMTAEEAATAAALINPKMAIPMHYGSLVGTERDAERFKERCQPIPVRIFSPTSEPQPEASS